MLPHTRHSIKTMTSVSTGHIILTSSRGRAATAGIKLGTSSPGVLRYIDWATSTRPSACTVASKTWARQRNWCAQVLHLFVKTYILFPTAILALQYYERSVWPVSVREGKEEENLKIIIPPLYIIFWFFLYKIDTLQHVSDVVDSPLLHF